MKALAILVISILASLSYVLGKKPNKMYGRESQAFGKRYKLNLQHRKL